MPEEAKPKAIVWAGALCGVINITAALLVYGNFGLRPLPLLQGIAKALIGPSAYQGGWAAAALGLLHFVIAFGASTVYFFANRCLPLLVDR